MLHQIITVLGPWQLACACVLFCGLTVTALHKWLPAAALGLSISEAPVVQLWLQLQTFTASMHGAAHQLLSIALAHAMLALVALVTVRALQNWARIVVRHYEQQFLELVIADEALLHAQARAAAARDDQLR